MGAPSTSLVKAFSDTFTALARQMNTRLRSKVMVDTNWTGEEKFYEQYGNATMTEIVSRLATTPVQDGDHSRRKVTPRYFASNILTDPNEAMAMLIDPNSAYMQAQKAAAELKMDELILDAIDGTAYTGKAGTTAVTVAAAQKVTVMTATTGLTKTKIIRAKRILDASEVDKEDRVIVHTAAQLEDLLGTTEINSTDYASVKALVQGEPGTFCGFEFVHSEQVNVDSSSYRLCPAFQKKGVLLAVQKEPSGRITERPDLNYAWQVYISMAIGATRLEEARCIQIACAEVSL